MSTPELLNLRGHVSKKEADTLVSRLQKGYGPVYSPDLAARALNDRGDTALLTDTGTLVVDKYGRITLACCNRDAPGDPADNVAETIRLGADLDLCTFGTTGERFGRLQRALARAGFSRLNDADIADRLLVPYRDGAQFDFVSDAWGDMLIVNSGAAPRAAYRQQIWQFQD